jgi:sulfhydrogenase subunit alpha
MRRLLYCGEWIESHALHIFMLHAPDFLGYDSVIEMAADHGPVVEMALRLKKCGNDLMELVGGRAIHPVNVKVGGFYRFPTKADLLAIRPALEQGLEDSLAAIKLVSTFDFPEMEQPYTYVALRHPDYYAIERGTVVSTTGVEFPVSDFPTHVKEFHVEHSNALHAHFDDEMYMVGPLARYTLNFSQLTDRCKEAALAAGLGETCRNQFKSIIVRAVELAYAFEEAIRIIDAWKDGAAPSVPVEPKAGEGMGASEAPRGIIFHRYVTDADGIIQDAQIVPPTAQNQPSIELDLKTAAQQWVDLDDHALTHRCEHAIRNYDPCISCATHFLDLRIDRS